VLFETEAGKLDTQLAGDLDNIRTGLPARVRADFDDAVDRNLLSKLDGQGNLAGRNVKAADVDSGTPERTLGLQLLGAGGVGYLDPKLAMGGIAHAAMYSPPGQWALRGLASCRACAGMKSGWLTEKTAAEVQKRYSDTIEAAIRKARAIRDCATVESHIPTATLTAVSA